jgi:hypothetical protein
MAVATDKAEKNAPANAATEKAKALQLTMDKLDKAP